MELVNDSPFSAERVVMHDGRSRDALMVVVKATYRMLPDRMHLADEQLPIQHADTFHGEADSSLRYECDLAPPKPATDVVLVGHAHAPRGSVEELDVGVAVGNTSQKIRVFGDRAWTTSGQTPRPTRPVPFTRMPLVYERAFGGVDATAEAPEHHEVEGRNPVGVGFRAEQSRRPIEGAPLPNLEDPAALVATPHDRPDPVGFGMIGRSWLPRRGYAGTYDEAWRAQRSPLLPEDFDDRFFQCAHPRMVCAGHLAGGEPVAVTHASPTGRPLSLTLPTAHPTAEVVMGGRPEALPLALDLVVLEPDDERAIVVWRGARPVERELFSVDRINVRGER
jgi:hypothetical protein